MSQRYSAYSLKATGGSHATPRPEASELDLPSGGQSLQVNHCRQPDCANFGIPARTVRSKTGPKGRTLTRALDIGGGTSIMAPSNDGPMVGRRRMNGQGGAPNALDRMRSYVDDMERASPLAFVGRQAIMSDMMAAVRGTAKPAPAPGMTRVVQGVPGAGKTALCSEFIARHNGSIIQVHSARKGDPAGPKCMLLCVAAPTSALDRSPLAFVRGVQEQLREFQLDCVNKGPAWRRSKAMRHVNDAGEHLGHFLKVDLGHESTAKLRGLSDQSTLDECVRAYKEAYWDDNLIIAVCIDEMQTCPATEQARNLASELHQAKHPGRLVLLCFGLPDTLELVSGRHGLRLSRLNANCVHEICLFEKGEAHDVGEDTFKELGLAWDDPEWGGQLRSYGFDEKQWDAWRRECIDAVVDGANDFPQHVTLGLNAICNMLMERISQFSPATAKAAIHEVRARHEAGKNAYYDQRLVDVREHAPALGAICRRAKTEFDGAVPPGAAKEAIIAGSAALQGEDLDMERASAVLQLAVRKGVLLQRTDKRIAPPAILSMADHLDRLLQQVLDASPPGGALTCEAVGLVALQPEVPNMPQNSERPAES